MRDELIDGILRPLGIRDRRRFRSLRRFESPVAGVLRALRDPLFQNLFLICRQRFLCDERGHLNVGVMRIDTSDKLALLGMSGHDGRLAAVSRSDRVFSEIQTKTALSAAFIKPVTVPAMIGQDWPHLLIKANRLLRLGECFSSQNDAAPGDSSGQ